MSRLLILAALAVVVGCAPTADLRVPIAEPARQSGRLVLVRVGDVERAPGEPAAFGGHVAAFWDDLRADLAQRYGFASVEVVDVPALDADAVEALVQNPPAGSARQGWRKRSVQVPRDPFALAPGADVVVVLDALAMGSERRGNGVVGVGTPGGLGVGVRLPDGQGVGVGADVLVFRAGTPGPVGVGRVDVYGRGSGLFDNRVDERSADRAVLAFSDRVAVHGGFARR